VRYCQKTDWFFLLAEWEAGYVRFGADIRRPSQLAQDWKSSVDLTVWEIIRFGGHVRGRQPAVKTFAKLFRAHAGTGVETEWGPHSNLPPP
jgi:hypothetical protein